MSRRSPDITADLILRAYSIGLFPMAESRENPRLHWLDPEMRGHLPLDGFHCSRSLARTLRRGHFTVTCNAAFGAVIAAGGSGVVIASQSGHRLPPLTVEQNKALAMTPADELLALPFLQTDQVTDSLMAYQLSKRGNSLRVAAEAVRWGKRGARVNTISPGIIMTPLARDELTGPRGEGYRRMIEVSAAGRAGTPDEVAAVGALLMGPEGTFITGIDFLMDGGVTAAYWYGGLAPQ